MRTSDVTELQVPLISRAIDPIRFVVDGKPAPKARHRATVIKRFDPKKKRMVYVPHIHITDEAIAAAADFLKLAKQYRPRRPLAGALRVEMVFVIPIPVSWSAKEKAAAATGALLPTSRPDLDNYVKLVCDALNKVFWEDDSQIVSFGDTRKVYGVRPRTEVTITQLLPGEA